MTGLIGSKMPKFSIFGDSMNTASRMESSCIPGHIQVGAWRAHRVVDQDTYRSVP